MNVKLSERHPPLFWIFLSFHFQLFSSNSQHVLEIFLHFTNYVFSLLFSCWRYITSATEIYCFYSQCVFGTCFLPKHLLLPRDVWGRLWEMVRLCLLRLTKRDFNLSYLWFDVDSNHQPLDLKSTKLNFRPFLGFWRHLAKSQDWQEWYLSIIHVVRCIPMWIWCWSTNVQMLNNNILTWDLKRSHRTWVE